MTGGWENIDVADRHTPSATGKPAADGE